MKQNVIYAGFMFFEQMHPSWQAVLADTKPLLEAIEARLANRDYVPASDLVMRALTQPYDSARVLIVGQDPYPSPLHAIGLSFAVSSGVSPLPRSLKNILIELKDDLGAKTPSTGDLTKWADQGVLLLNRHLTTDVNEIGGHSNLGWSQFTDRVIAELNRHRGEKLVAILWGAAAQELAGTLCDCVVLQSAHPSPLSARRGFFGSKPFSKANAALVSTGQSPIDWSC